MQFKLRHFLHTDQSPRALFLLSTSFAASLFFHGLVLCILYATRIQNSISLDQKPPPVLMIRAELVHIPGQSNSAPSTRIDPLLENNIVTPYNEDSPRIKESQLTIPEGLPPSSPRLAGRLNQPVVRPAYDKPGTVGRETDLAPEFEQAFTPKYPFLALSKGIRGSVTVSFRVGKEGAPEDIQIISSSSAGIFDAAVIQALSKTRIRPGSVRTNSLMHVTVVFDPFDTNHRGSFTQDISGKEQQKRALEK